MGEIETQTASASEAAGCIRSLLSLEVLATGLVIMYVLIAPIRLALLYEIKRILLNSPDLLEIFQSLIITRE